jgi:hypothetical protein
MEAVALQGAEIVRIAELGAQLLEDSPVAVSAIGAKLTREMLAEILLHAIVVEQRVIAIEKKDDLFRLAHSLVPAGVGLCHSVSSPSSSAPSGGPHVPRRYGITLW